MNKNNKLYQEDIERILSVSGLDKLEGKKILVTGATGLIGTMLVDALMKIEDTMVYAVGLNKQIAISSLGEYFSSNRFRFIEQDVQYPLPIGMEVDYVIPVASITPPLEDEISPMNVVQVNVKGCEHALRMAMVNHATLLYPSSAEIYGKARGNDVFTEDYTGQLDLTNVHSCYSESKRVCETMCQAYRQERDMDIKIVRFCYVFGPTMLETDASETSQFLRQAVAGENIVLEGEGMRYDSFIYVADAVAAMLHVMLNGEKGTPYNISSERCNAHLKDFAQLCADYNGMQVVKNAPSASEGIVSSRESRGAVLDNSRLLASGFEPRYNFADAVTRTIKILKNEE